MSVSVLVDGDNISGKHAARILSVAAQHGDPSIIRVYADAQRPSDWHGAPGYQMLHAGTGKNAADILLALDALEQLLCRGMRRFVIASSDGDFTHLATRLREHGAKVIGIGEAKAPGAFRARCTAFVQIGPAPAIALVPSTAPNVSDLDIRIRDMIAAHGKGGAGMRIAVLGAKMHAAHGVRISTRTEGNWHAYLSARPQLFDLDPRGPEAMVRFRPGGFGGVVQKAVRTA
ncbi:NYN domain-containing protein [Anianabacter salinae]|uniref:NYN domain-containing protein n=1 Tax=Anianabacter salinae TaxID=2851023 RepID=UPI00225E51FF|nr:NYN domain-containing protein [Anianabacter salinae]MBV0911017.1 NYN domain-containing protein [Anianabacter salinae]